MSMSDERDVRIYDYVKYLGEKTFTSKPQYVRGVQEFTCPFCGWCDNSGRYLWIAGFESSCTQHLHECEEKQKKGEHDER